MKKYIVKTVYSTWQDGSGWRERECEYLSETKTHASDEDAINSLTINPYWGWLSDNSPEDGYYDDGHDTLWEYILYRVDTDEYGDDLTEIARVDQWEKEYFGIAE